jgi:hypothetical protein
MGTGNAFVRRLLASVIDDVIVFVLCLIVGIAQSFAIGFVRGVHGGGQLPAGATLLGNLLGTGAALTLEVAY